MSNLDVSEHVWKLSMLADDILNVTLTEVQI